MANEDKIANEDLDLSEDESKEKKAAKHDSGAADLEKVTDYAEEVEVSPQNIDSVSNFYDPFYRS